MRIFMKRAAIGVAVAALLATALPSAVFAAGIEPNIVSITPIGPAAVPIGSFPLTLQAWSLASNDNAGQIFRLQAVSINPSVCDITLTTYNVVAPARMNLQVTAYRTGWCAIWVFDPGNVKFQEAISVRSIAIMGGALTVTADPQTQMYGDPSDPIGFTVTGLAPLDTVDTAFTTLPTCVTTRGQFDPPGVQVGANTCSGGVAPFYGPITYVAGDFTVLARGPVVVTANSYTLQYGSPVPAIGFTVTGLVPGDNFSTNPTCTTTYTPTTPVGVYLGANTCSGGVLSGNYAAPTYVAGNMTVTKPAATITADNKSKAYLAPLPALTWTAVPNIAFVGITCSTTATASSLPGTYPITCKQPLQPGLPNSNYSITFVKGTLTIFKGNQTITVMSPSTGRVGAFAALYGTAWSVLPPFNPSTGLPVAFVSATPLTCKTYGAYGTRVYFTGRGDCIINASQGGNSTWNPAQLQFHIWVSRD